jgi:hypothetical protein
MPKIHPLPNSVSFFNVLTGQQGGRMPSLQMQPGQGPPGNFPPSHGWRGPPPGGPGGMPPPFGTFVTPLVT